MICPTCGCDNLPGAEICEQCQQSLTPLDLPSPHEAVERSLLEDTVSVLPPKPAVSVAPETPVGAVIQLMLSENVGAVLVVDNKGQPLGIFSERDLLMRVLGQDAPYEELPVRQFMTPKPETVTEHDHLNIALHRMDVGGYRHLPVLRENHPVGMISVRDMLRHLTRLSERSGGRKKEG